MEGVASGAHTQMSQKVFDLILCLSQITDRTFLREGDFLGQGKGLDVPVPKFRHLCHDRRDLPKRVITGEGCNGKVYIKGHLFKGTLP